MAQIIKHRRGSLSQLKDVTARVGELVMATGSIGDLNGPIVFIGETEGTAGAYRAVSKIYQGTTVPTITVGSYGSTIDGTPFYASTNKTLYILNKDGNIAMDLAGNIEGSTISNLNITSLSGSNATFNGYVSSSALNVTGNTQIGQNLVVGGNTQINGNTSINGDLNITGNTIQTGSISLTGDVKLGGNIFIGDDPLQDIVVFASNISSSLVPSDNNAFDIGSSENAWKDLYVSGTAYINNIQLDSIQVDNISLPGDLTVSGTTTLEGQVFVENLTKDRIVVVGDDGELIDNADLTFNGTKLNIGEGNFEVDVTNGNVRTSGSLLVTSTTELKDSVTMNSTLTVTGSTQLKSTLEVIGNTSLNGTLTVTGSSLLKDNLSVLGTATVSGATTLENTLTVNSTSELKGDVGINSTLNVTGSAQFKSTIDVDGQATFASANVEDLTENRVVVVGPNGQLEDSEDFVFDGDKLIIGQGTFEVDVLDGDIRTSGSFTVQDLNVVNDLNVGNNLTITGATSMLGDLFISGNVQILGSATEVIISSSTVLIDDNIITLNAFSPFERYAGFEVMDSGSTNTSASLLWDSQNDYWLFMSSSGQTSKLIGTTAGTYGSEVALTVNRIPKATGVSNIGDSLLSDTGTVLSYNTNKFTVNSDTGATLISGNVTLSSSGGSDNNNKTSAIVFRNSNNVLGYVTTTETQDVLDGILGYKQSNGGLVFSTVIDGGTY